MIKIVRFFDKIEDRIRGKLSHFPVVYGVIGGIFVVLFWRGVWHTADILESWGDSWAIVFSGPGSLILSTIVLLLTGLFVSNFIGNHIIISGLKREKKLIDKTEDEIIMEKGELTDVLNELKAVEKKIDEASQK